MIRNSYDSIANDYDLKRKKPWNALKSFIHIIFTNNSHFSGILLDVGCGNGRNFSLFKNKNNKIIGIDKSLKLLKIARNSQPFNSSSDNRTKNSIEFINCDFLYIPLRDNTANFILSIASFHHIKDWFNRNDFMTQIHDLLKSKGNLLISVWRKYQKKYRWYFIKDRIKRMLFLPYKKRQIAVGLMEFGDKIVPWTVSKEGIIYDRFYHFFSKREIKKALCKFRIKYLKKMGGPNEKDNIFILAQKRS